MTAFWTPVARYSVKAIAAPWAVNVFAKRYQRIIYPVCDHESHVTRPKVSSEDIAPVGAIEQVQTDSDQWCLGRVELLTTM